MPWYHSRNSLDSSFFHQWYSRYSGVLLWVPHPVYTESHETATTCSSEAGEDKKVSMNEIKPFRTINKPMYVLNVIKNFFIFINLFVFYEKVLRHLGWKLINLETILIYRVKNKETCDAVFCLRRPCFPYNKLYNIQVEMFLKNHFQTQVTWYNYFRELKTEATFSFA